MRVLMTGASGFIGSGVLRYLMYATDWDFTCVASWRHHGCPINIPCDERVNVVTCDLTGPLPEMGDFDHIFHLASESHVDRSISHPVEFIENNVSSTLQVLEYARSHMPTMFILFGTDEVFGAREHKEWDVLLPSNPYAASKAAQEMIGIAYWNTYKIPVVLTNSNNIVGPRQDPEKFLPKLIGMIDRGEEVQIHMSNGKPGKRFYNPVINIADALLYITENVGLPGSIGYRFNGDRPPRFNIPGGEELDNWELARLVAETMDKPLRYVPIDVSSVRPAYDDFYPHTRGKLEVLGWKPFTTFRDELPGIIASYLYPSRG